MASMTPSTSFTSTTTASTSKTQVEPKSEESSPSTSVRHHSAATNPITVSNVADIFNAAGYAFKKLSELIQLIDHTPIVGDNGSTYETHWDAEDVAKFQSTLNTFNEDLNKLTVNLKNKMQARLEKEHVDKLSTETSSSISNNNNTNTSNVSST